MTKYYWCNTSASSNIIYYVEHATDKVVGYVIKHDPTWFASINGTNIGTYMTSAGACRGMEDHFKEKSHSDCGTEYVAEFTESFTYHNKFVKMEQLLKDALRLHYATKTYMNRKETEKFYEDSEKFINDTEEILK